MSPRRHQPRVLAARRNDRESLRMVYLPMRHEVCASIVTWSNSPDGRQVGVRHLAVSIPVRELLTMCRLSEEEKASLEEYANDAAAEDEEPVALILPTSETIH